MIQVLQVNLQHSKAATAVLSASVARQSTDYVLIQEPWVRDFRIAGLGTSGGSVISAPVPNPRACIWVKNGLKCDPVLDLCTRDMTVVKTKCSVSGSTLLLASAYMPQDVEDHLPAIEVRRLVDLASEIGVNTVLGCDSNAHNTIWGCRDTNARGKALLDFIASSNLMIANVGNEPTYFSRIGQSVIDLTLFSMGMRDTIKDWKVSLEPSLSDHRHISFKVGNFTQEMRTFRSPRKTDWGSFRRDLRGSIEMNSFNSNDGPSLDMAARRLTDCIVSSFESNCPLTKGRNNKVSWWSSELASLRKRVRALFRRAKRNNDWDSYHGLLTQYNHSVRRAKRLSWRNFCCDLKGTKETARIFKVLSRDKATSLGPIVGPNGETNFQPSDILNIMANIHFPGCILADAGQNTSHTGHARRATHTSWSVASRIVTYSRVRWAVGSLSPYKSPGLDEVRPICLQEGLDILIPVLCKLFRASLALGHVPSGWSFTRIVFIPKPGKDRYTDPKSFRPISLSSFMLKTMEKIVLRYVEETALRAYPLHTHQHAYIAGRSCESALHQLVSRIESALESKEVALGAFLDIQGAFDNTMTSAILEATRARGIHGVVCRWIESLLQNRKVRLSLHDEVLEARTTRGCPQGGVLSPLLWNLVVDDLIKTLNDSGVFALGYADDIVILVVGKFNGTIRDLMGRALSMVDRWCGKVGLKINPSKVVVVPFTRRRNLDGIGPLKLQGTEITLQNQVKYLGVILDSKLHWGPHLQKVIDRGKWSLMACRRMVGGTWGLQPKMIHWLYVSVVRPAMSYGSLVWWPKMESSIAVSGLARVQRLACLIITGALSSCPSAALDCLLDLLPVDIFIKVVARKSALRLLNGNLWTTTGKIRGHAKITQLVDNPSLDMPSDHMSTKFSFGKPFKVCLPSREGWLDGGRPLPISDVDCYTDGSKVSLGTGAGVFWEQEGVGLSIPMGVYPTVFQAEVTAIMACAYGNLARGMEDKRICIYTDSQAALKALNSSEFNSKLVWDCLSYLSQLSRKNEVTLCWVPGHSGIEGNEVADRLANAASATGMIGPQPFCGVSRKYACSSIMNWAREEHRKRWANVPLLRVSKLTLHSPSKRVALDTLRLDRRKIGQIIGLVTGHGRLRKHLHRLGLYNGNQACRKCGRFEETADHLLFDCEELTEVRLGTLGILSRGNYLPAEELIGRLQDFIGRMNMDGF